MGEDKAVTDQFHVFDLHPNMVYVLDHDLRFSYQNSAHISRYGNRLGDPCYRVHQHNRGACPACPIIPTLNEGKVTVRERSGTENGETLHYEVTSFPVAGADGSIRYSVNISRNITDRKRAEDDLTLFKELMNQSNDALLISDPATSRILYVNQKACSNLRYAEHELLGLRIIDVGMNVHGNVESWKDLVARVRRDGYVLFETEHKRRDHSTLPVEINARLIEHNGREYMVSVARDTTERRRAADVLLEEKNKLEAVIAAIGDGITLQDRNFRVLYQNNLHRELQGDHAGELCYEAYQNKSHVCEGCLLVKTFEDAKVHRRETASSTDRGSIHMEVSAAPVCNAQGEVVAGIEVVRNITERKKLEAHLLHCQKMEAVGHLAGGIAHDFNNILTAIIGFGNLLQMKMPADHPLRSYVEHILSSGERAATLTNRLLMFSRKHIVNPRPVDLNEIVRRVEKLLSRLISEDIELDIAVDASTLNIMADEGQIEQVLMNLATNARDAMPQGGVLRVVTEKVKLDGQFIKEKGGTGSPGDYAVLSISDTGVGMDSKQIANIFNPYFTTKEIGKGSGLGLSIVFGTVTQHNGIVTVESVPGKYSLFTIYLPMTTRTPAETTTKVLQQTLVGGTETVLIAEDEPDVRELTRKLLEEFGYEVIEAENGMAAVERFKENKDRIQLLIFDVIMPRMNGKEAYDRIREIAPGIKTLFMSGYDDDILRNKGGVDQQLNFLAKPVSPQVLLPKVRELLDGAK